MLPLAILVGIILLSVVILAHELGHFFAAKISHVKVEEFGIGFPPRLCKLFKKNGTIYTLNWIPFGGFNKILGEEGGSKDPKAYCNRSVWTRIFIAAGGILANLLLAWVFFTVWFLIIPKVNLNNYIAIVEVKSNSAAEKAGLKPNDFIIEVDGIRIKTAAEVTEFSQLHQGEEVEFVIQSQGKEKVQKIKLDQNTDMPLGVAMAETGGEKPNIKWYQAPYYAVKEIVGVVSLTVMYLVKAVASIFGGTKVPFEFSGPVGVVSIVTQTVSVGWVFLIRLVSVVSLGLAIFNILPLPAVDGGRLFFLTLEVIFGKKIVNDEKENIIHAVGFILLIVLSIILVYFDVKRLF